MPYFTDQLSRQIVLENPPKRIVSLVPSQTELLFDLGLDEYIVGITNYCIHPKEKCKKIKKIGGTKDFNIEKIKALKPDLIIGNKEENEKKLIEELADIFPLWLSDIYHLQDSLAMMRAIGEMTDTKKKADVIANQIENEFALLQNIGKNHKKVLYFIWREPYMIAAEQTFIWDMLHLLGFEQIKETRYPILSEVDIKNFAPDYIFLSSEPYHFKENHLAEFEKICPHAGIFIVDGEFFTWYGSRLQFSARYFLELLEKISLYEANK